MVNHAHCVVFARSGRGGNGPAFPPHGSAPAIDVLTFEYRCVALRISMSRCVDLRRWMCRLSKIDESTFGDGCVDLRRPMTDVSTFEDR